MYTPHKVKRISFAHTNKSIMAIKLPSTHLERFLRLIKSRVNYPKLVKLAIFKLRKLYKK